MGVEYNNAVLNLYRHEECGTHWADVWDCGCNDRCPKCNAEIEPYFSEPVADIEANANEQTVLKYSYEREQQRRRARGVANPAGPDTGGGRGRRGTS
jgi:hypothetical protein